MADFLPNVPSQTQPLGKDWNPNLTAALKGISSILVAAAHTTVPSLFNGLQKPTLLESRLTDISTTFPDTFVAFITSFPPRPPSPAGWISQRPRDRNFLTSVTSVAPISQHLLRYTRLRPIQLHIATIFGHACPLRICGNAKDTDAIGLANGQFFSNVWEKPLQPRALQPTKLCNMYISSETGSKSL